MLSYFLRDVILYVVGMRSMAQFIIGSHIDYLFF